MKFIKMKKIYLVIAFVSSYCFAYAQWETVYHPLVNNNFPSINKVVFKNYNEGIAVGSSGDLEWSIIMKTIDSGYHWDTLYSVHDSIGLTDVLIVNDSIVIAVGEKIFAGYSTGAIIRSTDFGNNWISTPMNFRVLNINKNNSMIFISGTSGVFGNFYNSTDNGSSWNPIILNSIDYLREIKITNDSILYLMGTYDIFRSTNNGIYWDTIHIADSSFLHDMVFRNSGICYAIVDDTIPNGKRIFKSNNFGNTWSFTDSLSPSNYGQMEFVNDTTGYLPGQFMMLKTSTGWDNLEFQHASNPAWYFYDDLIGVFFLNEDTGFAYGWHQFYRTETGGEYFNSVNSISENRNSINISPNPLTEDFQLSVTGAESDAVISIYNIVGQQQFHSTLKPQNSFINQTISLRNYSAGVYIVSVTVNGENFMRKVVKQ